MMNFQNRFQKGYIRATSYTSQDINTLVEGNFDVVLLASSWDSRSVVLTSASNIRSKLGFCIFFEARDQQGLRDQHDKALSEYGALICDRFQPVYGRSNQIDPIWNSLYCSLKELADQKGGSLNVLIDLSACPRIFSLGLMAVCLRQGLASAVTLVYSEGAYPTSRDSSESAFTGGRWKTIPIPYLEGLSEPGRKRFLLVSVGFEGSNTLRAVSQQDPDRVSLLLPDPGIHPDYVQQTELNNKKLVDEFRIPSHQIIRAPAGDAVATFEALDSACIDQRHDEETRYLCCGTKPHALALALRALATETPTVLYNVPEEHKVHETKPTGTFLEVCDS